MRRTGDVGSPFASRATASTHRYERRSPGLSARLRHPPWPRASARATRASSLHASRAASAPRRRSCRATRRATSRSRGAAPSRRRDPRAACPAPSGASSSHATSGALPRPSAAARPRDVEGERLVGLLHDRALSNERGSVEARDLEHPRRRASASASGLRARALVRARLRPRVRRDGDAARVDRGEGGGSSPSAAPTSIAFIDANPRDARTTLARRRAAVAPDDPDEDRVRGR